MQTSAFRASLNLTLSGSTALSAGDTFEMHIRDNVTSTSAVLQLTEGNSRITTTIGTGDVVLSVDEADLVSALEYDKIYTYDLMWTKSGSDPEMVMYGTFVRKRVNTHD